MDISAHSNVHTSRLQGKAATRLQSQESQQPATRLHQDALVTLEYKCSKHSAHQITNEPEAITQAVKPSQTVYKQFNMSQRDSGKNAKSVMQTEVARQ
jgi:hypothetical protein